MERLVQLTFVALLCFSAAALIGAPAMAQNAACKGLQKPACLGVSAPTPKEKRPPLGGNGGCAIDACEQSSATLMSCYQEMVRIRDYVRCYPKAHD